MEGDDDHAQQPKGWRRQRWWGLTVTIVVAVLVAWPGIRTIVEGDDAPDGFPLSTYPMFTRDRGRIVETPTVVAVDERNGDGDGDGDESEIRRLSPSVIADTDQVIEAHNVVRQAIDGGDAASAELCDEVAARVRGDGDVGPDADVVVQVVVERYDAIRWAAGDSEPEERDVVASC